LTTFPSSEKRVESLINTRVFLTNFEVFGILVKSKLKLRRALRNNIVKKIDIN